MGPPPRSFAADAQHCIMGLGSPDPAEYKAAARSCALHASSPRPRHPDTPKRAVVLEAVKAQAWRWAAETGGSAGWRFSATDESTMLEPVDVSQKSPRVPWNKGKLIGAKPPLSPKHVWSIRTRLQLEGRMRDLAMFNLAIDSKLRGCDVVAIKVEDVALHGYSADRATVRQRKTGRPVRFELTEQTRQAIDDYVRVTNKKSLAGSCGS
jgi:hypothetical protein